MQINKQEKSPIKQRILQYLDNKGVSKYRFYKDSGITRGVLDQDTGISEDTLIKFLAYAREISYSWILFGDGEMFYKSAGDESDYLGSEKKIRISKDYSLPICRDADFFTTVRGNYMSPRFNNGDIVVCKKVPADTFFFQHRVYVVDTEQGEIVTKVKIGLDADTIVLYSDLEEYQETVVERKRVNAIALVIGIIKVE